MTTTNTYPAGFPTHVGFFSRVQIEALETLLKAHGCPDEVIGNVWQAFDSFQDGDMLNKAVAWALSQCLPE